MRFSSQHSLSLNRAVTDSLIPLPAYRMKSSCTVSGFDTKKAQTYHSLDFLILDISLSSRVASSLGTDGFAALHLVIQLLRRKSPMSSAAESAKGPFLSRLSFSSSSSPFLYLGSRLVPLYGSSTPTPTSLNRHNQRSCRGPSGFGTTHQPRRLLDQLAQLAQFQS